MDNARIEEILQETAKLIPNLDKLMDEKWVNPLIKETSNIDPLSKEWFDKMIRLYTREGGMFYLILNWNLRANEWFNVQQILSPVVFALKCVLEGYCFNKFKDARFAPYDGVVHRVMHYKESIVKQIADFCIGDEIYWGGFTSCTKNPDPEQFKKIAEGRSFTFVPGKSGIYLKIRVHKEHYCAVDITTKSMFSWEEEVLISCFTRYSKLCCV